MIEIDADAIEAAKLYGSRWEDVLEIIRKVEALTPDQLARADALNAASAAGRTASWTDDLDAARADALDAAWAAASAAGRNAARLAAVNAAWAAAKSASWNAADAAAWIVAAAAVDAAAAAVVADLVEKHGLTAKHITDLTRAWRVIIGAA